VAGRDGARPSKGYLPGIPIFRHSIIPVLFDMDISKSLAYHQKTKLLEAIPCVESAGRIGDKT
jgi:hypothetical protein